MKLSRLTALVGLACVAAPSFAFISSTDDMAELYAVVWDENVGSYTLDLGITLDNFVAGASTPGYGFSKAAGPAYQQFVAADGNPSDGTQYSGTRWAIFAADAQSFGDPGEADGYRYLTTNYGTNKTDVVNIDLAVGTGISSNYSGTVSQTGTHTADPAVNGESYNPKGTTGAFVESDDGFTTGGLFAGNNPNSPAKFSYYYTSDYDLYKNSTRVDLPGTANFDGTSFTYTVAAVPEPATYALLIGGLFAVGFVAKRRS